MKKISYTILVISISIIFSQTGYITGTIMDKNNTPLPGANIYFYGYNFGTAANIDGNFKIVNLAEGKYTLLIDYIGYKQSSYTFYISEFSSNDEDVEEEYLKKLGVSLNDNSNEIQKKPYHDNVEIFLKKDPIGLDEVTVSASKFKQKKNQAPSVVQIVNQQSIRRNIGVFDFNRLVSSVKGVDVTYYGVQGAQINARGFDGAFNTRFRQLHDGVYMGELVTGLVFSSMSSPPKESISKIDIVFGPQAALYGPDAAQGLLNIIPKHARYDTGNEINFSLSNHSKFRLGGRYSKIYNDISAIDISFEALKAKEFPYGNTDRDSNGDYINPMIFNIAPAFGDTEGDTLHEDFYGSMDQTRNNIKITYYHNLKNGDEITLSSNLISAEGLAMGSYGVYYHEALSNTSSIKYNSKNHSLRYAQIYQDGVFINRPIISAYQSSCQTVNDNLPNYDENCDNRDPAEQMSFETAWETLDFSGDQWKFVVDGIDQFIDYQYNNKFGKYHLVSGFDFEYKNPDTERTLMGDNGFDHFTGENNKGKDVTEYRYGLYSQVTTDITSNIFFPFQLTASLRFDGHEYYKSALSPKLSLVFDNVRNGTLKMMIGKGFKAPNIITRRTYTGKLNTFGSGGHLIVYGNNSGFNITAWTDSDGDGNWNDAEEFTDLINEDWVNNQYDEGEFFEDAGDLNDVWDEGEEYTDGFNGTWNQDEPFIDFDNDGIWDDAEIFTDSNDDGIYNLGEDFLDLGNGELNDGEEINHDPFNLGNIEKLNLEENNSFEMSYTKLLNKNTLFEINGYITQNIGLKSAGRPIYMNISDELDSTGGKSNHSYIMDGDGNPINAFLLFSYLNSDIDVNIWGLDLGIKHTSNRFEISSNVSYFDDSQIISRREQGEGEDISTLSPCGTGGDSKYSGYCGLYSNTSNFKWNTSLTFFDIFIEGLDLGVIGKGNKAFDFQSGLFTATSSGTGQDYGTFDNWQKNNGQVGGGFRIDLNAIYSINDNFNLGLSVKNLFEDNSIAFPLSPKQIRTFEIEVGYRF